MRTGATLEKGQEGLQVENLPILLVFSHEADEERIEPRCCWRTWPSFVFLGQAQRNQNVGLGETATGGGVGGLSSLPPSSKRSKKRPQCQVRCMDSGTEQQAFPHTAQ